mgnify:CR=1 FL=1
MWHPQFDMPPPLQAAVLDSLLLNIISHIKYSLYPKKKSNSRDEFKHDNTSLELDSFRDIGSSLEVSWNNILNLKCDVQA